MTLFELPEQKDTFSNTIVTKMARIKTQDALSFMELQKIKLPIILKTYNINISRLCVAVGMSRKTFYDKLDRQRFTAQEMIDICNYINN